MTIKLYGSALTDGVSRVLAVLHEKEVTDYELVDVDMMTGAHKKPEFLAMHPFGQIPVLVDGPVTLFESRAIARYLAHKFEGRGTALFGSGPEDAALVEQWVEVESHKMFPAFAGIMGERCDKVMFKGLPMDEAALATHVDALGKALDVYDAHLAKSKYLAGNFFSLADVCHLPDLYCIISFVHMDAEVFGNRPHVKTWWEDISSRPACKNVSALVDEDIERLEAFLMQRKNSAPKN